MKQGTCRALLASLGLLLCGCVSTGADGPVKVPEPASGVTLVHPMQPTTSEDIGRRFEHVEDSPCQAAVRTAADGRKFIYLPVDFTVGTHRRVAWDIKVKEDWSKAKSVVFDFCAGPNQYLAGLTVYFHSVDGWYLTSFGVDSVDDWSRIDISLRDLKEEDRPAGWDKIDTIRISTWRYAGLEQDGWFGLANFGIRKVDSAKAEVLVIRGDTCGQRNPEERKSFGRFADTVMTTLEDGEIGAVMISDKDVASYETLKKFKLVVLPYNPTMPSAMIAALNAYVSKGGKLMAFYTIPREIARLMGVTFKANSWKQHSGGSFSGFMATSKALPGQPALARQNSWSSCLADPSCGRMVATWADAKGKDSGWPAIMQVRNGLYVGHVWLDGRGDDRRELMEALVNQYVPVDYVGKLTKQLKILGRQDTKGDWLSLSKTVEASGSKAAAKSLVVTAALKDRARKLLAQGNWQQAYPLVKQAQNAAERTYFLTRKSKAGERRLIWCHDAAGMPGWTWDQAIRHLAEGGFTDIIPNMCWGGVAYYPSKVLPTYERIGTLGDRVRQCLDACKKYGLECHVWKVCFNLSGHSPKAFQERMVAEGRVQKDRKGVVNNRWLCPSNPLNQQMEIDAMVELAKNYPDLHGIHFDYIRYSNSDVCFCDGCRKRFEAYLGRKLNAWPFDQNDKALLAKWYAFRRSHISHVVETVHEKVKAIRPEMSISAAVFSELNSCRNSVGQDWSLWCQKGWLDFVCPMDYRESDLMFKALLKMQQDSTYGVNMYPGIGISCWKSKNAYRLDRQIELTRRLGCPGFTVFNYDACMIEPLKLLPLGTTKEK